MISTWSPPKSLAWQKEISAGLWVDLEEAWALTAGLRPAVTCKRTWESGGGHRRDFMVGCPLTVAAVSSCKVLNDRWSAPHLAVRTLFDCCRWTCSVTQVVQRTPLWLASWLPAVDKSRGSKSVEVQRVWEVYDERLQFMSRRDALFLDASLAADDISQAWAVWSGAVESALADVFLYRDSSIAPLLDLRRRLKAVMELVDAMIRYGVSLSRSIELSAQWDRILSIGPLFPVTLDDFQVLRGVGLGDFYHGVCGIHRRLSDFIHSIVVHRRDEAIRGWRNWIREDPLVHPYKWLRPDLVPLAPFLQCEPHLTPGGSGVLSDPSRIDEEFRKAWLPYFCRSGQREASLEEFDSEVEGWLPLLPEVSLPCLTGQMLADVVQSKGATAGSLDGWGWKELKVLPVSWYDGLARILTKVEDTGVWPDGLLDAYIAMIPKTDGDAAPLGQRLLSVLPIVHRLWASTRMGQLEGLV